MGKSLFTANKFYNFNFSSAVVPGTPFEFVNAPGTSCLALFESDIYYSQILILCENSVNSEKVLVGSWPMAPQWSNSIAGGSSIWSFTFLTGAVRSSKDEQFVYISGFFFN